MSTRSRFSVVHLDHVDEIYLVAKGFQYIISSVEILRPAVWYQMKRDLIVYCLTMVFVESKTIAGHLFAIIAQGAEFGHCCLLICEFGTQPS